MKHILIAISLLVAFVLGGYFGWERHKSVHADELQANRNLYSEESFALRYFDGHIHAGLVEAIENKEFDLFFRVSCIKIRGEIRDLEYNVAEIVGKGTLERLTKAKDVYQKLEAKGFCEDEI